MRHLERFVAPGQTLFGLTAISRVPLAWEGLAQAIAAHDSLGYQAALAVLGNAAERDLRIVEESAVEPAVALVRLRTKARYCFAAPMNAAIFFGRARTNERAI